jgi:hypothetical protein
MKALLICPAERPAVALLAESAPLALAPVFGKSLIEYWLEHLVTLGAKEVCVLATDRPEQVRALVGGGARWGLCVEIVPEIRELSPEEAFAKYRSHDDNGWLPAPNNARVIDRLPTLPDRPLFTRYADWIATLHAWLPRAVTPDRIGVREIQPGIWAGLHARVSREAELHAPCWLGRNVSVERGAVIGPMAILEDRVFVEGGAKVSHSIVGPETFVGALTDVKDSLAWGNTLVHWRDSACTKVPDAFLLCSLNERRSSPRPVSLAGRLAAVGAMALTSPFAFAALAQAALNGQPVLRPKVAVRPRFDAGALPNETLVYYELASAHEWVRRWPQLWNVARGDFAWVGNRPLSPAETAGLASDFERLWLAAPIGLASLADAEACADAFGDEARAHASYYAVQAHWRFDLSILARVLFGRVLGASGERTKEYFPVPLRKPLLTGQQ